MFFSGPSSPVTPLPELRYENCTWHGNRHLQNLDEGVSFGTRGWTGAIFNHCTIADLSMRDEALVQNSDPPSFVNCLVTAVEEPDFDVSRDGNYVGPTASLSPPGNYGGRWPTLIPLPGSPALDRALASEVETDQRGLPRVAGAGPDAGAAERQVDGSEQDELPAPVVRLPGDPLVWDGDPENLSLRHALALARSGGTISLAEPLAGEEIRLEQGLLFISKAVEVAGPDEHPRTRLVPTRFELLEIVESGDLTFKRVEWSGIKDPGSAGIVPLAEVRGRLSLRECLVKNNELSGPVFLVNGTFESLDSHFENNVSSQAAGVGVLFLGASGHFDRCSFIGNRGAVAGAWWAFPASEKGGGLTVLSSTFSGNGGQDGGAINSQTPTVIEQSTIVGNEARGSGGGVFLGGEGHEVSNSIIAGNTAPQSPDLTGADDYRAGNFVGGDPRLAPAGSYGGPTMTMPPLGGSPVIDQGMASVLELDQRGQPRDVGAAVDFGAVEFQGRQGEFQLTFALDSDGDGMRNGLEEAIGRNPAVAEAGSPLDLTIFPDGTLSTGFDASLDDLVVFRVTRSSNLIDFETVLLSNENEALSPVEGFLIFTDPGGEAKGFYRVEVSLR